MLKHKRRGQAAIEFLMTYGWSILVVLVAIGALAYFGVLDFKGFLPSSCTLFPGLSCDDFSISSGSAIIVIKNGIGSDLTISNLTLTNLKDNSTCQISPSEILHDGESESYLFTGCSNGDSGKRFKGELRIEYEKMFSSIHHTKVGEIVSSVEGVVNIPPGTSFIIYPSRVSEEDSDPNLYSPSELIATDNNYLTVYDDRATTSGPYYPDRTYFEFPDVGITSATIATLKIVHQENILYGDTFPTGEEERHKIQCWDSDTNNWIEITSISPYNSSSVFTEISGELPTNCKDNIDNTQIIITFDPSPNTDHEQYFDLVELNITS